jgi:hypothetical protein
VKVLSKSIIKYLSAIFPCILCVLACENEPQK